MMLNPQHSTAKTASLFTSLLAAGVLMASAAGLKFLDLGPAPRILVALLPLPAFLLFIYVLLREARRQDELQQRVHLEGLVFAFPASLILILTTWLLYQARLIEPLSFSDASAFYMASMFLLNAAGYALAKRRYQ